MKQQVRKILNVWEQDPDNLDIAVFNALYTSNYVKRNIKDKELDGVIAKAQGVTAELQRYIPLCVGLDIEVKSRADRVQFVVTPMFVNSGEVVYAEKSTIYDTFGEPESFERALAYALGIVESKQGDELKSVLKGLQGSFWITIKSNFTFNLSSYIQDNYPNAGIVIKD